MNSKLVKHPCGFWQIIDKPTPEALQQYYADKYYQEAIGSYESEYTPEELQYFRVKFEQYLAVIQRYIGGKSGALLDVGCGEGYNLAFFKELGWSVKGLDFSSAGIQSKNPACLDALVTGDIYQLLAEEISSGHTYDVIWLQNVLEHVVEPVELLESLHALISGGGVGVVTVPNDYSIVQLAAKEYRHIDTDFWVVPPDHLNYFSAESLRNVAKATDWECVEVLGDFPVDWYLFHPGSNYVRDNNVGKAAHRARVQLENLIHKQPIDDVINFWSAFARIGVGRDITAFLQPARRDV